MKIIIDAFGGDNAPGAVLEGCAQAVKELGAQVILTGDEEQIRSAAREKGISLDGMEIAHAPAVIPVCEEPTQILKKYSDCSMAKGFQMLAAGEGDAFITAGSTGAMVVGATMIVKRIRGVKRAAIGTIIPNSKGHYMLLDSGANQECRPEMLRQFGVMGSVYMERIMGVKNPRVGVVNIGTEDSKGTDLQVEANRLLKNAGVNYVGNVEAREIPLGGCDVAVCDGFTGNVVLKLTEGLAKYFGSKLKEMFKKSLGTKVGYLLLKGGVADFKKSMDADEYGGAPLLGTRRPVIKAHGSSNARAIKNAIRQAKACVENDLCGVMAESLANLADTEAGN